MDAELVKVLDTRKHPLGMRRKRAVIIQGGHARM
jgi:hypothetical protein